MGLRIQITLKTLSLATSPLNGHLVKMGPVPNTFLKSLRTTFFFFAFSTLFLWMHLRVSWNPSNAAWTFICYIVIWQSMAKVLILMDIMTFSSWPTKQCLPSILASVENVQKRNTYWWAGETAHLVECWSCKYKDPSSIPRTHTKAAGKSSARWYCYLWTYRHIDIS